MFITVFSADHGDRSPLEQAVYIGQEFCLRGKTVVIMDASFTMSASLLGHGVLECSDNQPQSSLSIFSKHLLANQSLNSTYTSNSKGCEFPVFTAINSHDEWMEVSYSLVIEELRYEERLIKNLAILQKEFDVVIATNHMTVDDINGLLAAYSDFTVLFADSEVGATNTLRCFQLMRWKTILVRCGRLLSFESKGLAGSFSFWLNGESPFMKFLMNKVEHFTHVGAESRMKRYRVSIGQRLKRGKERHI